MYLFYVQSIRFPANNPKSNKISLFLYLDIW